MLSTFTVCPLSKSNSFHRIFIKLGDNILNRISQPSLIHESNLPKRSRVMTLELYKFDILALPLDGCLS